MAFVAMLHGCSSDPDAEPQPPPAQDAAAPLDTGVAAIPDAAAIFPMGSADAAPAMSDAGPGGIMLGSVDASTPAADGGLIINIPTRSVTCGGSECTTTNNRTCCQAWSRGTGFEGSPTCTTKAACEAEHPPFQSETNRAVLSECDEPGDCGGGQVCCFVRYGGPINADLFSQEVVGPGTSRMCMSLANCNAGMFSFSGVLGVPIGLVACKTGADCTDGASCMPEQANSTSTGQNSAARPGVMSCR